MNLDLQRILEFMYPQVSIKNILGILCLAVFLAPLLAYGPYLQFYVFSILKSDAITIYESVYGDGIVKYPSWLEFLYRGMEPTYAILAVLIASISLRSSSSRMILTRSIISSAILLTIVDIYHGTTSNKISVEYILENTVSNGIGGVLIGFLCIFAISVGEIVYRNVKWKLIARVALSASTVFITGILAIIIIFYSSRFIFHPVPVDFEIVLSEKSSGTYLPSRHSTPDEKSFESLLPDIRDSGVVEWNAFSKDGFTKYWESLNEEATFDVELTLISSCAEDEENRDEQAPESINYIGLNKFELEVDAGAVYLGLNSNREARGNYRLAVDRIAHFWLDLDQEINTGEITHFFTDLAELEFVPDSNTLTGKLVVFLFETRENRVQPLQRSLKVVANGQSEYLSLISSEESVTNNLLIGECDSLKLSSEMGEQKIVDGLQLHVEFIISESQRGNLIRSMRSVSTGGSGWLSISYSDLQRMENRSVGAIDTFVINGPIESAYVNSVEHHSGRLDSITALNGDLKGYYSDGQLVVSGTTRHLWSGQNRWSPTRWEQIDWPIKSFLLGPLGGVLYFVAFIVYPFLRRDDNITWLVHK